MISVEHRFEPKLLSSSALASLIGVIQDCADSAPLKVSDYLRRLASEANASSEADDLRLAVASSILADIWEQGWAIRTDGRGVFVRTPDAGVTQGESQVSAKLRLRNGLLLASDRQLASPSVQGFLRFMEKDRLFKGQIVSVRSLIDDGANLTSEIERALASTGPNSASLNRLFRPVLQVCDSDGTCEFTGHKLQDIWRYFRHTWSLEYNPLPGRTLRFLVRNRARKNSPIIGIAMLASPAANLYSRDHWIGWTIEELTTRLLEGSWDAKYAGKVLLQTLHDSISRIRHDDLLKRGELENLSQKIFFRLQQIVAQSEAKRRDGLIARSNGEVSDLVDIRSFGKASLTNREWRKLSSTPLFRKKRAEQLLMLLQALKVFQAFDFETAPGASLYEMMITKSGREAVNVALTEIRKQRLSTEVADLTVCGGVAPYNHLLGGKLVAMAMLSQEARDVYATRYASQPSEIASQLAGKAIVRPSDLMVLTTTSLYGLGSSQYNRLKLKKNTYPKLKSDLQWQEIADTEGFTVTHLSKRTIGYMRHLGEIVYGRRRINSVFGEGSSPRTRQVREALNLIGINNDKVLKQGLKRKVYAAELFPGARQALIGLAKGYSVKRGTQMRDIGAAWLDRWVIGRVQNPVVMNAVRESGPDRVFQDLRIRAERARLEEETSNEDHQTELTFRAPSGVQSLQR